MDVDELLRRTGARWRGEHSTPLALPDMETLIMPATGKPSRAARGIALPLVAAAVVALIVLAAVGLSRRGGTPTVSMTPSGSPGIGTPASASPTGTAAVRPADCTAAALTASVGQAGSAGGTENIFILLRNTGNAPCWLGGLLPLSAVRSDGVVVSLPFHATSDPAQIDPGPVSGPGAVAPGGYGAFHLTVGLNCPAPAGRYTSLLIQVGAGALVQMPFPAELSMGCPVNEAPAGPVTSPSALSGT